MSDWVSVSSLSTNEPQRTNKSHVFVTGGKKVKYPQFCRYCGHVPLNNGISVLVTKIGCGYEQDARYRAWVTSGKKPI